MRTIDRDQSVRCGRGFALVTVIVIAAGVLLAGVQPASAQVGDACTVNGQPGVFVCPPGSIQIGGACEAPGGGTVLPICQASGPSLPNLQKQAIVYTKLVRPNPIATIPYVFNFSYKSSLPDVNPYVQAATNFINAFKTLTPTQIAAQTPKPPTITPWYFQGRYYPTYQSMLDAEMAAKGYVFCPTCPKPALSSYTVQRYGYTTIISRGVFSPARPGYTQMKIEWEMPPIVDVGGRRYRKYSPPLTSFLTSAYDLSGGRRLGMDMTPIKFDLFAVGDGAVANNSSIGVRDATGLVKPGAQTPSSRSTSTGGGIRASIDATRWLDLADGQTLTANGYLSYSRVDSKSGTPAELAAVGLANTGTGRADNVTVAGDIKYGFEQMYVRAAGAFNFGRESISNTMDASEGSFDSRWYDVDIEVGKELPLAMGMLGPTASPALVAKEAAAAAGAYVVGLELSGHVGHTNLRADGFTDSTGFVYGTAQTRYETVGGRAKLIATVVYNNVIWMPYVAMKVDHRFDFSSTAYFPVQPDLPNGNVVYYGGANTFWGPELGLTIAGQQWWSVQARGFYLASADTNVAGGSLQLRIPFNP